MPPTTGNGTARAGLHGTSVRLLLTACLSMAALLMGSALPVAAQTSAAVRRSGTT